MIHFRSNIQTAEFGLYHQMYKHSAPLRVYKSDMNLLHGLYIASIFISFIYIFGTKHIKLHKQQTFYMIRTITMFVHRHKYCKKNIIKTI